MKKIVFVGFALVFLACGAVFVLTQFPSTVGHAITKKIQTIFQKSDKQLLSPLQGLKITSIDQINSSFTAKDDPLKFPLGDFNLNSGKDSDGDGLSDDVEEALGTDPNKKSTNNNGYSDKENLLHGYNPLVPGHVKLVYDQKEMNDAKGYLVSEVTSDKKNWFFWYVHPVTGTIYYIGKSQSKTDTSALVEKVGIILDTESMHLSDIEATKKDFRDHNPDAFITPQSISFKERPKSEDGTEYVLAGLQLMVPRKDVPLANKNSDTIGRIAWSDKQDIVVYSEDNVVITDLSKKCIAIPAPCIHLSPRDAYVAVMHVTPDEIDAKMSSEDTKSILGMIYTKLHFLFTISRDKAGSTLYEFTNSAGVRGFYTDAAYDGTTPPQIVVFTSPDHYFTLYLKGMTKSEIDFILSSLRAGS